MIYSEEQNLDNQYEDAYDKMIHPISKVSKVFTETVFLEEEHIKKNFLKSLSDIKPIERRISKDDILSSLDKNSVKSTEFPVLIRCQYIEEEISLKEESYLLKEEAYLLGEEKASSLFTGLIRSIIKSILLYFT